MNQINIENTTDDDEIDIGQIIHSLWHGKWVIIISAIITGAIGVTYAILQTPIYSGNALLQIEKKSSGLASLTGLADAFGGGESETPTELEILKSRAVIVPTIDKFNLEIVAKPKVFPVFGAYFYRKFGLSNGIAKPLWGDADGFAAEYAWGGEQILVNYFKVPAGLYKTEFEIIKGDGDNYAIFLDGDELFNGLLGKLHHIESLNMDIQIGKIIARKGTRFTLKKLDKILVIDELVKNLSIAEKGKKSGIVNISMLGADKAKIKQIIDHILSTYQVQNIEYNSIEANKSLEFVKQQLPTATLNLKKSEEKLFEYRLNNKSVDLSLQTQQLLNQLLKVEEGLNDLNLQEPEISRKFKREHPIYIEFLRKRADLEAKRDEINVATNLIPAEQFNIFRLQRDVELTQKLYLQMLNKHEELKIIKAGTIGSIRIIDDTVVHPRAVKPKKAIIAIIATMLGIIGSIGFILIRSMLFKGVESADQLEDLGYNVYASIPLSLLEDKLTKLKPRLGEVRVLSDLYPEELSVEALRGLRTSLHFAMMEAENNIIMITGPSPAIGKSFISQNLATLIAQSGSTVLLVDIDLRRGRLHDSFGRKANPGLSEYLANAAELDEVLVTSKIKNLDIITRGKCPPNPSELLMGKKFDEFCEAQKSNYDFIILDSPPILAVTDAAIAGKYCGTSMMVVKQGVNHLKEVELATNKLALSGVEIKGYIFNGISKKSSSYKSQNSYYQYEYK